MGGGNTLVPDHTLKKEAIQKYLSGGFNLSAIVYQVLLTHCAGQLVGFKGVCATHSAAFMRHARPPWKAGGAMVPYM